MRRALRLAHLAGAAMLLTSCSMGSSGGITALAAKLLWGLADGQRLMIYGVGVGTVRQVDASTYEVVMPSAKLTFSFSEPSPCHVEMLMQATTQYGKNHVTKLSADFTRVTGIEVQAEASGSGADIGKKAGLNVVWVKFAAGGDFLKPVLPLGYLFTSLTAADYQAAADELQRNC